MARNPNPVILIIDDVPEEQQLMVDGLTDSLAKCFKIRSPSQVTATELKQANLVLVDYKLEKWQDNFPPEKLCQHIPNGLALAAILQQTTSANAHAVAYAIHSAHLPELTAPFKLDPRIHQLAKSCNVDWAFQKDTGNGSEHAYQMVRNLASAVKSLPKSWPPNNPARTKKEARRLLGLTHAGSWSDQAWAEVERAVPPLDELVNRIHGLLFIRWLLQRVLPYPSFLLDKFWLAARLGATPSSVSIAINGRLRNLLASAEYVGLLHDFRELRWWRTGVEVLLWELGGGKQLGTDDLHRALKVKGVAIEKTASPHPVVCLDEDLQPMPYLSDSDLAIRIQPDDWPGYADSAWTTLELAKDVPRLRSMVVEADRYRLDVELA